MAILLSPTTQPTPAIGTAADTMVAIEAQYLLHGIPSSLTEKTRETLREDTRTLICLLRTNAPAEVSAEELSHFLLTLKLMYLEVGGSLLELPC